MAYERDYIVSFLTRDGASVEDYFIVGGMVMTMGEMAGKKVPMAFLIEDDGLDKACIDYLKGKGARCFSSIDEVDF